MQTAAAVCVIGVILSIMTGVLIRDCRQSSFRLTIFLYLVKQNNALNFLGLFRPNLV